MAACVEQYGDLLNARWKVIEGARPSISPPFYWVLVIWLSILFGSFGLTARPNVDGDDDDRLVRAIDHHRGLRHPRYG